MPNIPPIPGLVDGQQYPCYPDATPAPPQEASGVCTYHIANPKSGIVINPIPGLSEGQTYRCTSDGKPAQVGTGICTYHAPRQQPSQQQTSQPIQQHTYQSPAQQQTYLSPQAPTYQENGMVGFAIFVLFIVVLIGWLFSRGKTEAQEGISFKKAVERNLPTNFVLPETLTDTLTTLAETSFDAAERTQRRKLKSAADRSHKDDSPPSQEEEELQEYDNDLKERRDKAIEQHAERIKHLGNVFHEYVAEHSASLYTHDGRRKLAKDLYDIYTDKPARAELDAEAQNAFRQAIEPHLIIPETSNYPPFPNAARKEHMAIIAKTGSGKTQLMEQMIYWDIGRANLVVIDSKGDMIYRLAHLKAMQGHNVIVIDPKDRPALSLFDVNMPALLQLPKDEREDAIASYIANYVYLFRSFAGAELTGPMEVVFTAVAELMMYYPKANIETMIDVLDNLNKLDAYSEYIQKLSAPSKRLLSNKKNDYDTKFLSRRIYQMWQRPAFSRMFSASHNALDLAAEIDKGAIILIDTSIGELSPIMGRYFIAQTMNAAYHRARSKRNEQIYLYIDEAAPYFDENAERLFTFFRSYGLSTVVAFQDFAMVNTKVKSLIRSQTAIKLVGGGSDDDANFMAQSMSTSPAFIMQQQTPKGSPFGRFACHVSGDKGSLPLTVTFGYLDKQDTLDKEEYRNFRRDNRKRVRGAEIEEVKPEPPPEEPPEPRKGKRWGKLDA